MHIDTRRSYWPVRCANAVEVYYICDAYYKLAQGTKEMYENTFQQCYNRNYKSAKGTKEI